MCWPWLRRHIINNVRPEQPCVIWALSDNVDGWGWQEDRPRLWYQKQQHSLSSSPSLCPCLSSHQQSSPAPAREETSNNSTIPPRSFQRRFRPSICVDEKVLYVSDHVNDGHHDQHVKILSDEEHEDLYLDPVIIFYEIWNYTTIWNMIYDLLTKISGIVFIRRKMPRFFLQRRDKSSFDIFSIKRRGGFYPAIVVSSLILW